MAAKLKESAHAGGEGQLATSIKASAHQIWLAGLGAFAKAQREGTRIFESLVEEGETVHEQTKKVAEEAFSGIKAKATKSLDQLSWTQLENVFVDRVARALHALNVPTRQDLDTLSQRVAELTEVSKKLSDTFGAPARPHHTAHRAAKHS